MALVSIVIDEPAQESPTDEPRSHVQGVFTRISTDERVMTVHGYGVSVKVWNGQLQIDDGIGRHRRTRKIPKADRQTERLVITGTEGYISLAALRWCIEHGVSVTTLDRDGDLVATHVPEPGNAASLLRRQALAGPDGTLEDKGIEVSRFLLNRKLRGQSANLVKLLNQHRSASRIDHYADMLSDATTYEEINELERWTANTYFTAWRGNVSVPWPDVERDRIPANWIGYERRKAGAVNTSKRYASDPVNAMLNYSYTIGYAEARIACIANHLNPLLGFLHSDNDKRDSLALDILEAVRPDVDAYILGLLGYGCEPRTFSRKDFCEPNGYPHGTVRLVAPLTHEIAEQSMIWQEQLTEIARDVAGILGAPAGKQGRRSHNLAAQKAEFQAQAKTVNINDIMPESTWDSFRVILPVEKAHPRGGFAPISSRNIIAAMVYLTKWGKPFAHVPPSFGVSHRTLSSRRQEWKRLGMWDEVERMIHDLAVKLT